MSLIYGVNLRVSQASLKLKHLLKTQCWKDKAAVHRAYYKLAVTSASPNLTDEWDCFFHPPHALLYFHTCTATCCALCVSAPREWVMRTAGAHLKSWGSLTEKWAEATTLRAASGRQSCSSAWQPRNLQAALEDSATCNRNFMLWHPNHRRPTSTSGQNTARIYIQKLLKVNRANTSKTWMLLNLPTGNDKNKRKIIYNPRQQFWKLPQGSTWNAQYLDLC